MQAILNAFLMALAEICYRWYILAFFQVALQIFVLLKYSFYFFQVKLQVRMMIGLGLGGLGLGGHLTLLRAGSGDPARSRVTCYMHQHGRPQVCARTYCVASFWCHYHHHHHHNYYVWQCLPLLRQVHLCHASPCRFVPAVDIEPNKVEEQV